MVFCISDSTRRVCEAEELRGKRCWATSSGWVLSCDPATADTFLWNPSARDGDRITLPPPSGSTCVISGSPTNADGCTVVLFEPGESTVLWYCHIVDGPRAWTRYEYDIGTTSVRFPGADYSTKRKVPHIAPCRGRFYYLDSPTGLGVIDFPTTTGPPKFSILPVKQLQPLRDPGRGSWLQAYVHPVDIDGDLYVVRVVYHGLNVDVADDVSIYRMDFARNEFFRADDIGDRAVVACGTFGGGWCPATEFGMMPNSVYWMSPLDKRLHVFGIGARMEKLTRVDLVLHSRSG